MKKNLEFESVPVVKKKHKKWPIVVIILAFIVVIGIIGSNGNDGSGSSSAPTAKAAGTTAKASEQASAPTNSWSDKFDVKDIKMTSDTGIQYATGTIVNKTDKEYSYLQVEINEYDSSGAQIGSTLANVNNLEAKGKWKFKAVITDGGTKSVKLKDVTGF